MRNETDDVEAILKGLRNKIERVEKILIGYFQYTAQNNENNGYINKIFSTIFTEKLG